MTENNAHDTDITAPVANGLYIHIASFFFSTKPKILVVSLSIISLAEGGNQSS
jgi:hypothetical protein